MNCLGCLLLVLCAATSWAQTSTGPKRREAEYYVAAYAQHYRVPVPLVRAKRLDLFLQSILKKMCVTFWREYRWNSTTLQTLLRIR
jgi:hypothetical protein